MFLSTPRKPFRGWVALWLLLLAVAAPGQPPQPHPSLVRLCRASSLDDSQVGESATASPNYQAYLEAGQAQVSTSELEWLCDHGTPAGRVYGALLLTHSGRVSAEVAFAKLLQDRAELRFASGCEVLLTTVAEVSQAMIKNGSYLGFTGQPQWLPWNASQVVNIAVPFSRSPPGGCFRLTSAGGTQSSPGPGGQHGRSPDPSHPQHPLSLFVPLSGAV